MRLSGRRRFMPPWMRVSQSLPPQWREVRPAGDVDSNWDYNMTWMANEGSTIFIGDGTNLFITTNHGVSWSTITKPTTLGNMVGLACDSTGQKLIVGGSLGRLFTSINGGSTWVERRPAGIDGNRVWVGIGTSNDFSILLASDAISHAMWYSTNAGANWTLCTVPNGDYYVSNITTDTTGVVFAASRPACDTLTSSDGITWTAVGSYTSNNVVRSLDGQVIMLHNVPSTSIQITSDGGSNWNSRSPGAPAGGRWFSLAMSIDGTTMFAATDTAYLNGGRIYTSINYGVDWTEIDPTGLGTAEREWWVAKCNSDASIILAGITGGRLYMCY